jgi:protein-disulfide isomerase
MRPVSFLLLGGLLAWAANPSQPGLKAVGSPSAPITIEVFSDFECPHCKTLHDETLPPLIRDYVAPGKVYLIYREFPLPGHPYALVAASYATAAAHLGKYNEVADRLWLHQTTWSQNGKVEETACRGLTPTETAKVIKLAKEPAIAAEIQRDVALGQKLELHQTPTMIVRRGTAVYPLAGMINYDLLRSFLDSLR